MATRKRKQYSIKQYNVSDFDENFNLKPNAKDKVSIKLAENQVCDLILRIQGREYKEDDDNFIPEMFFLYVDNEKRLREMLNKGNYINNKHYIRLGRSASMARNNTIAIIDKEIRMKILDLISLGRYKKIYNNEDMPVTVSKLEAYLGLCFSTTLFINSVPKNICIVGENLYNTTIREHIKTYTDVEDEWGTYKDVVESEFDVDVTLHDGMGVHSPTWGKKVAKELQLSYVPVGYQIRLLPGSKGMTFEFDFKQFYKEKGITHIKDIWGKEWAVDELDCIWSSSLFKLQKYFSSMEEFMQLRSEYYTPLGLNQIGISKWSKPTSEIPTKAKMTYQYLQNLNLSGSDLEYLAKYTKDIIEKVYKGDSRYTLTYLGMIANQEKDDKEVEEYLEDNLMATKVHNAIQSNPDMMIKDPYIKSLLKRQLKKTIDGMKLGRIYVEGANSFICQDPVLFCDIAANLEPKGCLEKGEFYSTGVEGYRATFRSPLIHSSEIGKLNFINNDLTEKWLNRYDNIIILNGFDLTAQKHGGADLK